MNKYAQNFCRICFRCFCCVDCRLNHEKNYHNVHVDCDICVYGKVILKNPTANLLRHIEEDHFPVYCLYCKKIFKTVKQLTFDHKCPASNFKNQVSECNNENYDSPPISVTMHKSILISNNKDMSASNMSYLTTSTPMQKCNEWELEKITEVITPVDYSDNAPEKIRTIYINNTNITPISSEYSESVEIPLKRKVTFCETPMIDNHSNQKIKRNRGEKVNVSKFNSSSSILKNTSKELYHSTEDIDTSTIWKSALTEGQLSKVDAQSIKLDTTPSPSKENENPNCTLPKPLNNSVQILECSKIVLNDSSFKVEIPLSTKKTLKKTPETPKMIVSTPKSAPHTPVFDSTCENTEQYFTTVFTKDPSLKKQSQLDNIPENVNMIVSTLKCAQQLDTPTLGSTGDDAQKYMGSEFLKEPSLVKKVLKTDHFTKDVYTSCSIIDNSVTNVNINVILQTQQNLYLNDESSIPDVNTQESDLDKILSSDLSEDSTGNRTELEHCGVWSSVTNAWKTVMKGLTLTARGSDIKESKERDLKRMRSDDSSCYPPEKRVKIIDIKCRNTIHAIPNFKYVTYSKRTVMLYDKATQTD